MGYGAYCGLIAISSPEKFPDENNEVYDWWEFDNAPINKEQLSECVVLGLSIDGDYIAIHQSIDGYILIPRQDVVIKGFQSIKDDFRGSLREVSNSLYGEMDVNLEYYQTICDGYLRVFYKVKELKMLAEEFKNKFNYDFIVGDHENSWEVFIRDLGGSVRFNLAYGGEIVIGYCDYGRDYLEKIKEFFSGDNFEYLK